MILLTVGTEFPFDRLVKAVDGLVDRGLIREDIVAQVGEGAYKPHNFEAVAFMDKDVFDRSGQQASAIIGHAGMGTIVTALAHTKPLLAMPRRRKYGEHVNDHQVELAIRFEALGHILLARDETELAEKIVQLKSFLPRPRKANPEAVSQRIAAFLSRFK
jgi:beta-1,4-N-acetylglucosaminyltransferase